MCMTGTLTILPDNSSFKSMKNNIKSDISRFIVPCYFVPYQYARSHENFINCSTGKLKYCIYYDSKSYKETFINSVSFLPILPNIRTYVISKLENIKNLPMHFSTMEDLLLSNWEALEIQVVVTSDLKSIQYIRNWFFKNPNINGLE